ncbi:hypothetical protein [Haloarcula laminariae]|uniref:hypothetical protein n=1 Tax=Haloarcula laminariae TaxID=2961577 RepID=UPI00240515C3|nr:hypothetical protein [Halomicroarcula sp. FL173]
MSFKKSLPLAVLIGCCIGGGVYRYLLSDWFFVSSIATIYIGVAYFILAYDVTLLSEQFTFYDRYDRLGHAVGVFGLSIGPLALIEYVGLQGSEVVGVLIWSIGIIAYFVLISNAQSQQRQ